jgi:type II secretory pathway pseudopilin PulG
VSLVEALVALVVLAIGSAALARMQVDVARAADLAHQRTEAARLAQADLEDLRATARRSTPSGALGFDHLDARTQRVASGVVASARYRVTRGAQDHADAPMKSVDVQVDWIDPAGGPRQVRIAALLAREDPAWSGLLTARRAVGAPTQAMRRAPGIPVTARDLGDGRSAFRPAPEAPVVWLFDNASGWITQRCAVDPADPLAVTTTPGPACEDVRALLVSGHVGFAVDSDNPRTADAAADAPRTSRPALDLDLAFVATHGAPPHHECHDDAGSAVRSRHPLVAYHCLVATTGNPARWSGRLEVMPRGWAIGAYAPDHYRVCRHSTDANGNGRIDNAEHPGEYLDVDRALLAQNFLVVRGRAACPADALRSDTVADGTVPHQPPA